MSLLRGAFTPLQEVPGIPRVRFVIICAARTGSTMLRTMLNGHPQILCHGEVFAGQIFGYVHADLRADTVLARKLRRLRRSDPVRYFEHFVYRSDRKEAVGAKLLYSVFDSHQFAPATSRLIDDTDVRVIHLTRRNHVARIVSKQRVNLTGISTLRAADRTSELPVLPRVTLTYDQLVREVADTQHAEQRLRKRFSDHPVFELAYEDIHPDAQCVMDLQCFLDVAPVPLQAATIKISSDPLREALTNFDDLAALARGTPHEAYFA